MTRRERLSATTWFRALAATAALVPATVGLVAIAEPASGQVAPGSAEVTGMAVVELIGDSLAHAARSYFPDDWRIVAQNGRPLSASHGLIRSAVTRRPGCLVVALGSNDVSARRTAAEVIGDIRRVNAALAEVACVAWTTVKVAVGYYGADWSQWARRWNRLLRQEARGAVLDWNAVARRHPSWFLGDGLHMTVNGRAAYAHFLAGHLDRP